MTSTQPSHSTRDFIGYANRPPAVAWPGGARVAVSFVLNFEEGAEFSVADGDARNESVYEVIDPRTGWDPCIDSHFEYGTRAAWWRIAELLERHRAPMTVSACGRAVARSPWLAQDAVARGHEVSAHGWRWESHAGMAPAQEAAAMDACLAAIEAACGRRPVGWHTRSACTPNTRALLAERGFLYDSDAYNDDLPFFVPVAGRPHLVLPYAFDTNDMQFQHTQRFATAAQFAEYVCDAFDWLHDEGAQRPRMMSVGLHLRMIGRPARMKALALILDHLRRRGGAWIATREQIARHWLAHAPRPDAAATAAG
ncbi:peptidoglycan/xylan/chitin deacetylase (PgdA/CDA1 family) [Pseudacidovorax sp. 1753]|uniref:polysaccharide deacetylase family protein n=1 Tax=Pseudacidovorax sp. 1753 TaxID=3156419 RepID=UPI003390848C